MKPHHVQQQWQLATETDQYERSAEFVDVMLAPFWTAMDPVLREAATDNGICQVIAPMRKKDRCFCTKAVQSVGRIAIGDG